MTMALSLSEERQELSPREKEILALLATGATNQEIARALYISPNTVKVHLRNIYAKLGVMNRSEAILVGLREGIITLPGVEPGAAAEALAPPPMPVASPHLGKVLAAATLLALLVVGLLALWPRWARHPVVQGIRDAAFSDLARPALGPPRRRDAKRWSPQAPAAVPRARAAVAVWQGRIYLIGGEQHRGVMARVDVFDPARGLWSPAQAKPTAVSNMAAALLQDRIYVFGGTTTTFLPTDVVEVYDPVQDAWSPGTPLPHPLAGYALAVWHNRAFLFGGWDGARYLSSVYMYDPDADQWHLLPPMETPRAFAAAVTLDDLIYVVGGYDGRVDLADLWVFDPKAALRGENPWSQGPDMLSPRGGAAAVVAPLSVYVIGGGITLTADGAERYDLTTRTWSRVDTPYGPNWRHMAAAFLGGDIYTLGGWAGDYLAATERYRASFRNFIPFGPVNREEP